MERRDNDANGDGEDKGPSKGRPEDGGAPASDGPKTGGGGYSARRTVGPRPPRADGPSPRDDGPPRGDGPPRRDRDDAPRREGGGGSRPPQGGGYSARPPQGGGYGGRPPGTGGGGYSDRGPRPPGGGGYTDRGPRPEGGPSHSPGPRRNDGGERPQREGGGGSFQRGPRRDGGGQGGGPRDGGYQNRGPRPEGGGGYQDRGPRREGGGGYSDRGSRPEGGGGYQNRGPRPEGSGGYQDRGPRREGGGGYSDRGSRPEGGGGYQNRGPRPEGSGGYQDRGPRREGGGGYSDRGSRPEGGGGYQDRGPRSEGGGGGFQDRGPRREGGYSRGPSRDDRDRGSRGGDQVNRNHYRAAENLSSQPPAEQKLQLVATCALGLELIVGRELEALGLGPIQRDNAQVAFPYTPEALAKANYWLRAADRVWLQLAEFPCRDFEELYQGVHSIDWASMLPRDAWFPLEVIPVKSQLESVPSCQAVAKKAAVEKMSLAYGRSHFSESGAKFAIRVFIVYNRARVFIDTSGEGLHRRGYRTYNAKAPLRETVAAALVLLSHWTPNRELYDPMCGSGTILLEAASIGLKKAAGLDRSFASQRWDFIPRSVWEETHKEALDTFIRRGHLRIYGSDNDGRVLKLAREHLLQSGFEGMGVNFQTRDVKDFASSRNYGVLITNPPYGKRLSTGEEVRELTEEMGRIFAPLHDTWSLYFFTAFEEFSEAYGHRAERVRKIYNGTIPCQFYQFPGPRPPEHLGGSDGAGGSEPPVVQRIPLKP